MVIGSFTAKDLSAMYHLPANQKKYDKEFVEKFMQEMNINLRLGQGYVCCILH